MRTEFNNFNFIGDPLVWRVTFEVKSVETTDDDGIVCICDEHKLSVEHCIDHPSGHITEFEVRQIGQFCLPLRAENNFSRWHFFVRVLMSCRNLYISGEVAYGAGEEVFINYKLEDALI